MSKQEQRTDWSHRDAALHLESIIASAMDAIISVDEEQKIILFNPGAEQMFGISAHEAIGSKIDRFIPERFRHAHSGQVKEFGATGATHRRMGRLGAVRGLRANGQEFPAEASISQTETDRGKVYTVILRDISERQAAQEALQQAHDNLERLVQDRTARLRETISELESISYTITHDMRAPLRAIQSFGGILEEEAVPQLSEAHRDYVRTMMAAAGRMDQLIRDVLTYNTIVMKDLPVMVLDPLQLLHSVVATYPSLQTPSLELEISSEMPEVLGNEALLTQCFSNFLSNAIKFRKRDQRARVKVSAARIAESVRISFQDNGVGIPGELHERIFGLFQRLGGANEGTGMGLAIVRKAAERMGGSVSVDSREGEGSTFHLDLPAPGTQRK